MTLLNEQVARLLKLQQLTLTTAESCTGGGLSFLMTSIPNSSDWFERGFVTYSNASKVEMLGVSPETLATHGAVSEATAKQMAEGALTHSNADVSIAITGIAGPSGGTPDKPVGTVWIAWAKRNQPAIAQSYLFPGDRQTVRESTIEMALKNLQNLLS